MIEKLTKPEWIENVQIRENAIKINELVDFANTLQGEKYPQGLHARNRADTAPGYIPNDVRAHVSEKCCCTRGCLDERGNSLCTNGVDTYHEFNVREDGVCPYCLPKKQDLSQDKHPDCLQCNNEGGKYPCRCPQDKQIDVEDLMTEWYICRQHTINCPHEACSRWDTDRAREKEIIATLKQAIIHKI